MPPRAVIVFSIPEPEDDRTLHILLDTAMEPFVDIEGVTVHLAISDVAEKIMACLNE